MPPKFASEFFPKRLDGIAIDLVFAIFNFFIFRFFSQKLSNLFTLSFSDDSYESAFKYLSLIMLMILALRLIGLYLKRFRLQSRLVDSDYASFPMGFMVFNIALTVLTGVFAALCFMALAVDLGFITKRDVDSPWAMGFNIVLVFSSIGTELYLLWRLSKPLTDAEELMRKKGHLLFNPLTEIFADFGLFAFMMVWQVFYFQTAAIFSEGMTKSISFFILSMFFCSIMFALFYLSPRTVFLIEDRKYKATWISIGLVFLSSLTGSITFFR